MKNKILVDFIIPTALVDVDMVRQAVDSIRRYESDNVDAKILVVVERPAWDRRPKWRIPNLKFIRNEGPQGNVGSTNTGWNHVRRDARWVVRMDDDAALRGPITCQLPLMVKRGIRLLGFQATNANGPTVSYGDAPSLKTSLCEALLLSSFLKTPKWNIPSRGKVHVPFEMVPHPVDYVAGALMLIDRSKIPNGPLFNEMLVAYGEDLELGYRLNLLFGRGSVCALPINYVHHGSVSYNANRDILIRRTTGWFLRRYHGEIYSRTCEILVGIGYMFKWLKTGNGNHKSRMHLWFTQFWEN